MPTRHQGDEAEVLALNVFIKLTRAVNALNARIAHRHTVGELTVTQFGVLETIYHLGPLPQCDIGAKLLKSGGNITLVLDNLERLGLVERHRAEHDRRVSLVSLTDCGRQLISDIFPRHAAAIREEMSVLTGEEQEELARLCKKLGTGGGSGRAEGSSP